MHEFHYRWEFDLKASPEQLWPLVADTNRFNRDAGVPSVEMVNLQAGKNARRLLRLSAFGRSGRVGRAAFRVDAALIDLALCGVIQKGRSVSCMCELS
jgi:hypothetical protein